MPTYEITAPDGKRYRVDGPEGSTPEQAMERVKAQHGGDQDKPSGFVDFFKSMPRQALSGLMDAATASGQGAAIEMGQPEMQATIPNAEQATQEIENGVTGPLPQPSGTAGKFGGAIARTLANPGNWIGPGGPIAKTVTGIGSAVGSEAAGELTHDSPLARSIGAVVGGAAPGALAAGAAGMRTPATRQPFVDALRREGVEPTAGDVTGSRALRKAETTLGDAPGGGGAGARETNRVAEEFTSAVNSRMGQAGERHATPEVIQRARDNAANMLDRAAARLPIQHDRALGDELTAISADLMREGLPPDTVRRITQQIDNVQNGFVTRGSRPPTVPPSSLNLEQSLDQAVHNINASTAGPMPTRGIMDGATYQSLTRKNTPLARAIDDPDPNVSYYATRIRSALDDAMERTANARGTRPGVGRRQALEDLREARRIWYNSMVVAKAAAAAGEGSAEGLVTPQKLRALIANTDDKKIQYALGRGDLAELARAGNAVLTRPGSSQTAERSLITALPAAAGAAMGQAVHGEPMSGALIGTVAPGLAGRALMSPLAQGFLKGQLPGQGAARAASDAMPDSASIAARSLLAAPLAPGQSTPVPRADGGADAGRDGGEGPGPLLPPPANPVTQAAGTAARAVAPNLTGMISGDAPPPLGPLPEQGKVPGTGDPRLSGAVTEATELGMAVAPFLMPGGAAVAGGRLALEAGGALARPAAVAGSALGMAAAASDPAAAAKLTRKQQQELQFKRETLRAEADAAAERSRQQSEEAARLHAQNLQAEAAAKRQEAEDSARIATEKQAEEARITREHEKAMADRPFRERFPNLATAMGNSGLAMSALLPYGTRLWQAAKSSQFAKAWEDVAIRAEEALSKGDMPQARLLVDQLSGFKKQAAALEKAGGKESNSVINVSSAALPFETSVAPEVIDAVSGSPKAKERAREDLLDPTRALTIGQGSALAALGSKWPLIGRQPSLPAIKAQTEGATKTYRSMSRQKPKRPEKGEKPRLVDDRR